MGSTRGQIPTDIRMIDADTLVRLRRKGESIGLSGRWSSDQLAENLPRGIRFPIRVILINQPSAPSSYAPLVGSCYRCLVANIGKDSADSQFQIDLDSTDYEGLELMTQRDVLMMARNLLDKVEIDVP
jgi:hypothetical protein